MKRFLLTLLALALVSVLLVLSNTTSYSQGESTVVGEVVDINCWLAQGFKGESHRDCAIACAKLGASLVILHEDGSIYFPVIDVMPSGNQNDKLIKYAERKVKVAGRVVKRGKEKGIIISKVELAR